MNITPPLQKLYRQSSHLGTFTPLDEWVCAYIDKTEVDCLLIEQLISQFSLSIEQNSLWSQIEKWREMLALALFVRLNKALDCYKKPLADKCLELMKNPFWEEFQLESCLRALNCQLLDLPCKKIVPQQWPDGAIPLESGGHWPWGAVPHARFQAELGILWYILGDLQNNQTCINALQKAAEWQLNTLDHHCSPFKGLYVQEEDASLAHLLIFNYFLFHLAGMESVAQKLLKEFELLDERPVKIPPYVVILEAWINAHRKMDVQQMTLPTLIDDPHAALAGYRSPECSLALTLKGGGTGMGAVHREDVQLVSYGPQHLPLGDCRRFGIEVSENHRPYMKVEQEKIDLHHTVRMVSKPKSEMSPALFRNGDHSTLWIEAKQKFSQGKLNIETTFLGLNFEDIAFAFFANAPTCYVDQLKVNPRSFERYQGKALPIQLKGKHTLTIEAFGQIQEMSVIPLGGGENFWGADFLIAYLLTPKHHCYAWEISL